ncbi:MAG TPA: DEAD/DEAH box helicase [Planctomycetota bacterium]|nr:DEAD/DEAH box helicase [Planctomycetota bacterium]
MSDEAPSRAVNVGGAWTFRGKRLFPFQERAATAIHQGRDVIVAAPTGAGKTLVADVAIAEALSEGRRVVYTSPVKALSNQKFRDFRADYGEDRVGIMTGDVTINPDAGLLIMTTEIFRNTIFESPERLAAFDFVIYDEVHYLDDIERGTVWEESIIYAPPHVRVVALSATVPNVKELAAWIEQVRGTQVEVVVESERPVPLVHKVWVPGKGPRGVDELRRGTREEVPPPRGRGRRGRHDPRPSRESVEALRERATGDLLAYLRERDLLPALYFVFSRRDCEHLARTHAGEDLLSPEDRERLLADFDELAARYEVTEAPSTRELRRLATRGVLWHHAGMLPIDKEIVERLFTTGRVRLLFATETFALGVNMPARTVCFHALKKFDGVDVRLLRTRDYGQMAGRAGRQGIDTVGHVFAVFDARDADWRDVDRLQHGVPEAVRSRFNLNYASILNLYDRIGDRVLDAWLKSFARFHANWGRRRPAAGEEPAHLSAAGRATQARLDVLEETRYVEAGRLTRKGKMAARISGYEIACTEAYEGGFLSKCDAVEAAMLFASIVYEARPADEADPSIRPLKGIWQPLRERLDRFRAAERRAGLAETIRTVEPLIFGLAEAWAEGEDFAVLESMGNLAPGDLVRVFRMTIQIMRQVVHAVPAGDPVRAILEEAITRVDRDVVDARRQLELG